MNKEQLEYTKAEQLRVSEEYEESAKFDDNELEKTILYTINAIESLAGVAENHLPYPGYDQELREYLEILYLIKQDRKLQNQTLGMDSEDPKFGGR